MKTRVRLLVGVAVGGALAFLAGGVWFVAYWKSIVITRILESHTCTGNVNNINND